MVEILPLICPSSSLIRCDNSESNLLSARKVVISAVSVLQPLSLYMAEIQRKPRNRMAAKVNIIINFFFFFNNTV